MGKNDREQKSKQTEATAIAKEIPKHSKATRIADAVKGRRAALDTIKAERGEDVTPP